MKITISGVPGSGKTVVAKELAKKLKLKRYSMGNFVRKLARKKKISLLKLCNLTEKSDFVDKELDKRQLAIRNKDNFVIDGRISFYFIPESIKIFLDADFKVRAKRIFNDNRKGEHFSSLLKTEEEIKQRAESERRRYKKYYSLDYLDRKHYDYILDTSNLNVKQATDKIIGFIKKKKLLK